MDYKIHYHEETPKDIANIPNNIKVRIKKAIEERLLIDPIKYGEPLRRSYQGYRKLRVGDYRIIYRIDKMEFIILKIVHRKEVYQKVKKR